MYIIGGIAWKPLLQHTIYYNKATKLFSKVKHCAYSKIKLQICVSPSFFLVYLLADLIHIKNNEWYCCFVFTGTDPSKMAHGMIIPFMNGAEFGIDSAGVHLNLSVVVILIPREWRYPTTKVYIEGNTSSSQRLSLGKFILVSVSLFL